MPVLRTLIPLHHAGTDLRPGELFAAEDPEAKDLLDRGWAQPCGVTVNERDLVVPAPVTLTVTQSAENAGPDTTTPAEPAPGPVATGQARARR